METMCTLCYSLQRPTKRAAYAFGTLEEAKVHARMHFVHSSHLADGITEDDMFKKCFPKFAFSAHPAKTAKTKPLVKVAKNRYALIGLCRSLFGSHPKAACALCNICGTRVQLLKSGKEKRIDTMTILVHACRHLDIRMFKCRHCEKMSDKRICISNHSRRVHGVAPAKNDVEDLTENFSAEISATIKRCFAECKLAENPEEETRTRDRLEITIRSRTNASELGVQRLLFCNQLIRRDLVDSDGKIACRLCSKQTTVKCASGLSGELIMMHVYRHMRKPIYQCGICTKRLCTRHATATHLQQVHALGLGQNYKCFGDDFHAEIMDMASKCFAQEPTGR